VNDGNKGTVLAVSKQVLDFNMKDERAHPNIPVHDAIELRNVSNKKVKFKFDPVHPNTCQLKFIPANGSIDPNKTKKVKAVLVLLQRANLNFKVTLRIQGGDAVFLNLRVAGEVGVFGVDPLTLEMVDDNGLRVPSVLVSMKNYLVQNNGFVQEGIFRLAGEQTEIYRIKDLMNKKAAYDTNDVNAIATLIKIWYRDLPLPVLNALPQESIVNCGEMADCVTAYNALPEPQKTLVGWLLDLLAMVAVNSPVNKMTSQNLAIVLAPNLYDINSTNPMEGLILSQKCAQFFMNVLNSHMGKSLNETPRLTEVPAKKLDLSQQTPSEPSITPSKSDPPASDPPASDSPASNPPKSDDPEPPSEPNNHPMTNESPSAPSTMMLAIEPPTELDEGHAS